jgi:hypothetical protein
LKVGLIPWINSENQEETYEFLDKCSADVIGGHFELVGFDMMRGIQNTEGMSTEKLSRFELVMSGHFHCKSSQDNIHYLGSQMEFFWNDCDDPKHFHILDTETRELTAVRNPLTLFEKVYYDDTKFEYAEAPTERFDDKFVKVVVLNKSDPFTFERYIDRIQARNIHELKIQEDFSEFLGTNVDDEGVEVEETSELLKTYVDNVETVLDKERLKAELTDLMIEAQALEIA